MRKQKLKIIESYIYSKTLFLLCKNTEIPQNNSIIKQFLIKTGKIAEKLHYLCVKKINKLKLNNTSFLLLKQQLENINYKNETLINWSRINNMLKDYDYYFSIIK